MACIDMGEFHVVSLSIQYRVVVEEVDYHDCDDVDADVDEVVVMFVSPFEAALPLLRLFDENKGKS